uniref:Zinc transporter ZIP3 n=1 Tax=Rhabditophanes sp. KR3021 TaxID=114890 RepID=A0AC35U9M3_9BILA
MENFYLQLFCGLAIWVFTTVAALAPHTMIRCFKMEDTDGKPKMWLSLLLCLSGGVFLSTCFLDILPEIEKGYGEIKKTLEMPEGGFPWPHLTLCLGFFFVYLLEEVCSKYYHKEEEGIGHSHELNLDAHRIEQNKRSTVFDQEEASHQLFADNIENESEGTADSPRKKCKKSDAYFKALTFAIIMCFHSVLEGVALGVKNGTSEIVVLFLSLTLHKVIEAFAVGLQISKTIEKRTTTTTLVLVLYASMTPLGALLGGGLKAIDINAIHRDIAVLILECLAAGTFIYITFLEVISHERAPKDNNLLKLLAVFAGFALIAGIQLATQAV